MTMLTVREVVAILRDHHFQTSEQMVRRWLREGKLPGIRPENRKQGWKVNADHVFGFLMDLAREGTIYEYGIDDTTRIDRLFREVERLEHRIKELEKENRELEGMLGIQPF